MEPSLRTGKTSASKVARRQAAQQTAEFRERVLMDYLRAGICVIPLRLDGSKAPHGELIDGKWKRYQHHRPMPSEIWKWSERGCGVGIVCGRVSGGIEVLDFDQEPDRCFPAWQRKIDPTLAATLPVIETGGGGYHVMYRCRQLCPPKKIALPPKDAECQKPFVESRGEASYIVAVGSPLAVHKSKQPYVQVSGVPLPDVPMIDPQQRAELWRAARELDRSDQLTAEHKKVNKAKQPRRRYAGDPDAPSDDFDARATWESILEPHGWEKVRDHAWRRPGSENAFSATIRRAGNGQEVLCCFTSSTALEQKAKYGKFRAYATLTHGGNYSEATKAIRQMGYGGQQ